MTHNEFDAQYYVMSADGANNHPLLAWGKTDSSSFRKPAILDETELNLPLQIVFGEPYPKQYEMPDFLMLSADFAVSKKLKKLFDVQSVGGVQHIPVEITSNKGETVTGYHYLHVWSRLRAIDEDNYEGGEPDEFGQILDLERFSLNAALLNGIPLDKRLVFSLEEDPAMIIVHQSIREAIEAEGLTGMRFFRVDEWDEDAMFT